ncbi:MAG TPA: U32 family peptidase [Leptolyngbyaceae cyanobacterium M65_K2018_010]|nr:U32 family peptidase [Leptolyngbyaceae cyanobacterium M65_K2018_010]
MPALDPLPPHPAPPSPFSRPELLAPAGNWDCAKAAVENGADAIYFGLERFNARMRADNFTEADLPRLMTFLHQRGVKGYVTLNTLIFTAELTAAEQYLKTLIAAGVDGAIVQDLGLCRLIRHLSPDFPIHASTQMTITSAAGVEFAQGLGCQLVVLARECSMADIAKIQAQLQARARALPLEVFVHGALCVAYSGQCLTSEALGGRSANRGECAQACRMAYDLIADGKKVDLGDRQYLLSPQDLSGLEVLPELLQTGVRSLKIEGRLKAPEYVANVTRIYRRAIDALGPSSPAPAAGLTGPSPDDRYQLEMAFSRGLYTGWLEGIDNQTLVHGRFGKKRGVYLGTVTRVTAEGVWLSPQAPVKAGDGVVFDQGQPADQEEGGRIYQVLPKGPQVLLRFGRQAVNLQRVRRGDRVWKTSDPALTKALQQTYAGDQPQWQRPITVAVHGEADQGMTAIARDDLGHIALATSAMPLVVAQAQPLTEDRLRQQFSRLGHTPFYLQSLENHLVGAVMLPVRELNRLRRSLVDQLLEQRSQPCPWQLNPTASLGDLWPSSPTSDPRRPSSGLPSAPAPQAQSIDRGSQPSQDKGAWAQPQLTVLVRHPAQLAAALQTGIDTFYCEWENPAHYRDTVAWFRDHQVQASQTLWVAPPRITKPLETYILEQVRRSQADGYLVRNYDHLEYFADQRCVGDFSFNVANALTADYLIQHYGLERVTASYDLNADQLGDLLRSAPSHWFEITLHQHMPLFHMEHCVFCAFLSSGQDFRDCGRPCEQHQVKLRDRKGTEHILQADAGCRNTLFNGVAQTGAEYAQRLMQAGAQVFRLEFLDETPGQVTQTIQQYQKLLRGEMTGAQLWRQLRVQSQLGVTRGPLDAQ